MALNVAASSQTPTDRWRVARSADRIVATIERSAAGALRVLLVGALGLAFLGRQHVATLGPFVAIPFVLILATGALGVCAAYVRFGWFTPPGVPLSQRSVSLQALVWLGRWAGGAGVMVISAMAGADLALPGNSLKAVGEYLTGALLLGPPVAAFTLGLRLALVSQEEKRAAWIGQWLKPAAQRRLTIQALWLAAIRRWTRSGWTLPILFFVPYLIGLGAAILLLPTTR